VKVDECWDENVMFQIEVDGGYERSNGRPFPTLINYLLVFHTTNAQLLEKTFHFSCDK
jgi:hypothetical protein